MAQKRAFLSMQHGVIVPEAGAWPRGANNNHGAAIRLRAELEKRQNDEKRHQIDANVGANLKRNVPTGGRIPLPPDFQQEASHRNGFLQREWRDRPAQAIADLRARETAPDLLK